MPTVHQGLPVQKGIIRCLVQKAADKFFTDHAKRWIFISSLVGMAYPKQNPDFKTVEKINKIFHLVNRPEALEFPMFVKSVIWKDCDLYVLSDNGQALTMSSIPLCRVSESDTDKLAAQVVGQTPEWLRYMTHQIMFDDVKRIMANIQERTTCKFAV